MGIDETNIFQLKFVY